MAGKIDARLNELEIELPAPVKPAGNYTPYIISGKLLFVSGQLPTGPGGLLFQGRVGADLSLENGKHAARQCTLNLLAQAKAACEGDLDLIRRCVRLEGFVHAAASFEDHPAVMNGASDLMVEIFGEAGRHTRTAVGVNSLPLGAAVEIAAVFEIV